MRRFTGFLFVALVGCVSDLSSQPYVDVDDMIERCEARSSCFLSGEAEVVEVGHSILARYSFPDGSCINLVLDDEQISRSNLGTFISFFAAGRIQNIELHSTEFLVRYNGVRVDVDGSCNDLFFISVN